MTYHAPGVEKCAILCIPPQKGVRVFYRRILRLPGWTKFSPREDGALNQHVKTRHYNNCNQHVHGADYRYSRVDKVESANR